MKPNSLFVRFFVRMDDVSKRILDKVNDEMSEEERNTAIEEEIKKKIEEENSEGGKYVVSVRSFFQGNEYYYFCLSRLYRRKISRYASCKRW